MLYCFLFIEKNKFTKESFIYVKYFLIFGVFLFFLLRDTFVLCLVNGGSSFVAGFAIFSVLGFMSYEQGLPISEVAASGKNITTPLV